MNEQTLMPCDQTRSKQSVPISEIVLMSLANVAIASVLVAILLWMAKYAGVGFSSQMVNAVLSGHFCPTW